MFFVKRRRSGSTFMACLIGGNLAFFTIYQKVNAMLLQALHLLNNITYYLLESFRY